MWGHTACPIYLDQYRDNTPAPVVLVRIPAFRVDSPGQIPGLLLLLSKKNPLVHFFLAIAKHVFHASSTLGRAVMHTGRFV